MISTKILRRWLGVLLIGLPTAVASAQQLPPPGQAQQMLQNNPALIARLQQMMQTSGLTPDQIRDRLKAQGYPESLLDQYLPGGTRGDSLALPGEDVFAAVRSLGLGDSTAVDSLSRLARGRRQVKTQSDSAFMDTLRLALKNDSTRDALRIFLRSRELQRSVADSGFDVFGAELFKEGVTSFDPTLGGGGADPNYRFGAGDQLVLILTGDVEKSYPLTVTRDGFVVIPNVGVVNVAGLTRSQLDDVLYRQLGRAYSGVRREGGTTHFYVNVSRMGENQVFVQGDVKHPNGYRVSRAGTAMTALYAAGGPTAAGSMRNVQVKRNGQTVAQLDIYDYALSGDASHDMRLENGDIVFVPPRGPQVRVAGQVLRPATYEVKPRQTLGEVLQMAGGFNESADRRRVQIERILPPAERKSAGTDRKVIDVASELISTAPVEPGDLIRVLEITKRVSSRVNVLGNVWSPGAVAFTPGMRLYDALRQAGGLKPDSYLGQVLVARLQPDSTRQALRAEVTDTTGRTVGDFTLADGDEITVYSTTTFRPHRYITISGAVRKSGRIDFQDGMTLRDAVLQAKGLTEGALLTEAEIARLPENRPPGVTAVTENVPLDSTYLFERGPNGRYLGPPGVAAPTSRAPEVVLHAYDAILIKRQPEWQLQRTVSVQGEVKYPGPYALTSKSERLSDIIARAGGLTASAYPEGISFIRRRDSVGRVGLNLGEVLRNPRHVDNLILSDGDSIFIPPYAPVVTVRGAVNAPTGVAYVAGADIDYYVRAAGGETIKGDFDRAFVTQPGGKLESKHRSHLFWTAKPRPQPGGAVYVPEKDPNQRRDWGSIATAATSILGSLVTVAVIVKR
jgi:polysaccharide biosynthesis/export protein